MGKSGKACCWTGKRDNACTSVGNRICLCGGTVFAVASVGKRTRLGEGTVSVVVGQLGSPKISC
ncbi:hypothetical protein RchiOBHm_Chr2g0146901 [Rosa chinensis]|uniref:Uncharacterized protein n=1 Tax=Rosa chinensis TaxID=74649 RepID=A0A2P6RYZ3_ROSCH|nr:hypothetical protein RchiOBHm_Chr2g0146901 [Rosa chinensis]